MPPALSDVRRALAGRSVRVPRDVFAADIEREASNEPPDGVAWDGIVTDINEACTKFTVTLRVDPLEGEDEDEPYVLTLLKLRDWIVLVDGEARSDIGELPRQQLARTASPPTTVSAKDIFVQTPTPT